MSVKYGLLMHHFANVVTGEKSFMNAAVNKIVVAS